MSASNDPLGGLDDSLADAEEVIARRFAEADSLVTEKTSSGSATPAPAPGREPTVRLHLTLPVSDHQLLAELRSRCWVGGFDATKTHLVRAALRVLHTLSPDALAQAIAAVEPRKPGPPPKTP